MHTQTNISTAKQVVSTRAIGRAWLRWARIVEIASKSKAGLQRISPARYHEEFRELQTLCHQAEQQTPAPRNHLYRTMLATLEPWSELSHFQTADEAILHNLTLRVALIQTELGQRPIGRSRSRFNSFAFAMAAGLAVMVAWTTWGSGGGSGASLCPGLSTTMYRLWHRSSAALWGFNVIEITVVIVTLAVLIGLYAATRTRSF